MQSKAFLGSVFTLTRFLSSGRLTDVPPLRQAVMHVVKKLTSHEFYALLFALGVNWVTVYHGLKYSVNTQH